jgi:hypothetical protein
LTFYETINIEICLSLNGRLPQSPIFFEEDFSWDPHELNCDPARKTMKPPGTLLVLDMQTAFIYKHAALLWARIRM